MLALLAIVLAGYHYATGEATTLPLQLVPHLQPVPLTLEQVPVGTATLPVQANGYLTTLTHDLAGPFTRPDAAAIWVALLGLVLTGWLAVVSTLPRSAFVGGMALAIFFLMSLNADLLGVFNEAKQYFLLLSLVLLGGTAFGLHAFGERITLPWRSLILSVLVAGLGALLFSRSTLSPAETALHLAAYATPGGAALLALLVLWLGIENIHGLLWLSTRAAAPGGRFGVLPLLGASLLYLGTLGLYYWNNGDLLLFSGLRFDPLVLLLPAALVGGLSLGRRARTVASWLPYAPGLRQLYPLLLAGATGALGYALATANGPLLQAAREFTNLAFLALGTAFLIYLLLNFSPLLRQRLPVYRVVFEPRRFPYYAMYALGLLAVVLILMRNQFGAINLVRAGLYNELGDLTRQQSEAHPDDLGRALLAERYYAESDALDRNNRRAALGRAALYRFRGQPRNELLALSRALHREPSEKISLHLAALYSDPKDFFDAQQVLRQGLRDNPNSAALASDLAQLYTHSTLTDSVAFYLDLAQRRAPGTYAGRTNQLAFLLSQNLLAEAQKRITSVATPAPEPAFASNLLLLRLLQSAVPPKAGSAPQPTDVVAPNSGTILNDASFALLYHAALAGQAQADTTLLPTLRQAVAWPENSAYSDQLLFAQALLLHGAGQEQRARQLLAPLTAGTSPTAAYYQYLRGLWQLRQGQYGTAAVQMGQAATNGVAVADVARAYAFTLAGQTDSARADLAKLIASPDTARQSLGRQLARQLDVRQTTRPANAPAQLPATIMQVSSVAALRQLASATAARSAPASAETLRKARLAELENHPAEAAQHYAALLQKAAFDEVATLAAADFYTRHRDYPAAYEALRRGLIENPESALLLQAYVLAATRAGLSDYAADALARLRPRLSPAAYTTLQQQLAAVRASQAATNAGFSSTP